MIQIIYGIILGYFVLGGIGFYWINRRKPPEIARQSYIKFGVYFALINLLFFSIVMKPPWFHWLGGLIVAGGLVELFRVLIIKRGQQIGFFVSVLFLYGLLSVGLLYFSRLPPGLMLFSFLVLSIFDSFSQISGQLFGKRKLVPKISPQKTVGGLLGGTLVALLSAFWLRTLLNAEPASAVVLALGIVFFAFWGDLGASYFKRQYGVKDFSSVLPGHGGILDRYDSLLAGSTFVSLMFLLKLI